ncbi:hypothetical protein TbgDal_IX1320 [Trypanosoma brucei gambiense DAL972]|uniref:Uncharacterized protein n=1 Tax=Trypanosoma brucei gambiense (strain MHOM/CI/86/DAL972) TaxID=679716 RepID=C9ZXB3_TRYB9|nr:hypothetical protein TbgDal_IX1320 [Trypanosoma brucei gambiense DAL972]CBH14057.1 hypothetical protein TbgDal_IX1320 [Trypanosoma brucei gambiense DAL972]|eukprot:XP_011776328.1 hypothetical protein TbgDal_IX1320 [Trypanosoma brucei gambiense DAL972]
MEVCAVMCCCVSCFPIVTLSFSATVFLCDVFKHLSLYRNIFVFNVFIIFVKCFCLHEATTVTLLK